MKPDSLSNTVLITGINGFTGTHLEKYLQGQGFDVVGTVIGTPTRANHIQCDITQKDQVEQVIKSVRPDYIVHIAAISFVGESNASLIYDVNVIGTENILQSLLKYDIRPQKTILASSATVYGNQGKEVLDESMCPAPVNHYGCSKLAMEHMAATYFDKLDMIITRPFNYTGIGQEKHFLIPKIVAHFKEKKHRIELGNLDVVREFNDVDFVCEVYRRLLESPAKSEVVNIASDRGIRLLDVITMMEEIAEYDIDVRVNPAFVRKNEIKQLTGSPQKLHSLIGEVSQRNLKQTLRMMFEA
jgi:nucleoside-diphosphate-sugar epimerase